MRRMKASLFILTCRGVSERSLGERRLAVVEVRRSWAIGCGVFGLGG